MPSVPKAFDKQDFKQDLICEDGFVIRDRTY
jgi:hypothetical protein